VTPAAPGKAFEDRFAALVDALVSRKRVRGGVFGIRTLDGTVRRVEARGEAAPGGPPMTQETPVFIASITKLHIACAVMRLVEEGELALGDRLVELLPSELTRYLHVMDGVDRTGEITLEHLLGHASGLPDYIEDYPAGKAGDRRSLVEILVAEGDRDWSIHDTVERVRTRLRPHFPPSRLDAPRVRVRYSDTNYQLLLAILEARTGQDAGAALTSLVLEPLGLHRTWLPAPGGEGAGPRPEPAAVFADGAVLDLPRFFASLLDLYATADDLLDFMGGLVEGRLFRDPATWARMQAPSNRFGHPTDRAALRQPSWPIAYGLGVMRFELPRVLTPFRPVPPVVGHTGSTGTWLFHAPDLDLLLVGAVSDVSAGPLPYRFVPRVLRAAAERPRK
jgi:D-alanyl-D-alanine carboxypeptidase